MKPTKENNAFQIDELKTYKIILIINQEHPTDAKIGQVKDILIFCVALIIVLAF